MVSGLSGLIWPTFKMRDAVFSGPPEDGMRKQPVPATEFLVSSARFKSAILGREGGHATREATEAAQWAFNDQKYPVYIQTTN